MPRHDCHGDGQKVQLFIGEKRAGAARRDGRTRALPGWDAWHFPARLHHPLIRQDNTVVLPAAGTELCRGRAPRWVFGSPMPSVVPRWGRWQAACSCFAGP